MRIRPALVEARAARDARSPSSRVQFDDVAICDAVLVPDLLPFESGSTPDACIPQRACQILMVALVLRVLELRRGRARLRADSGPAGKK